MREGKKGSGNVFNVLHVVKVVFLRGPRQNIPNKIKQFSSASVAAGGVVAV